jgi:hypothetical protein
LKLFPSDAPSHSPNLVSLLREAIAKEGTLTQTQGEGIARHGGAKDNREKIRKALETIQGPQKPGPRGPRKNRAVSPA